MEGCECHNTNRYCDECHYKLARQPNYGEPFQANMGAPNAVFQFHKSGKVVCPECNHDVPALCIVTQRPFYSGNGFVIPFGGKCIYCAIQDAGWFDGKPCLCAIKGRSPCATCANRPALSPEEEEECLRQKEELIALLKKEESKI